VQVEASSSEFNQLARKPKFPVRDGGRMIVAQRFIAG
jgi:hypothetical protein